LSVLVVPVGGLDSEADRGESLPLADQRGRRLLAAFDGADPRLREPVLVLSRRLVKSSSPCQGIRPGTGHLDRRCDVVGVRPVGGLDNQMSNYAPGRAVGHRSRTQLKLDVTALEQDAARRCRLHHFDVVGTLANPDGLARFGEQSPGTGPRGAGLLVVACRCLAQCGLSWGCAIDG